VIVNASPLIIFSKIHRLDILMDLCSALEISKSVYSEVVIAGTEKNIAETRDVQSLIESRRILLKELTDEFSSRSDKIRHVYCIDPGESDTLALCLQLRQKEIIIDERAARLAALALGIKPTGSLGILLRAFHAASVSEPQLHTYIEEIVNHGFRLSPSLILEFWRIFDQIKSKKL